MDRADRTLARDGAIRQARYRDSNPMMIKLSEERRKLSVLEKRANDPEYDAEVKRKANLKKANQRLRKKSGMKENEVVPELEANINMEPEENVFEQEMENDENAHILNVSQFDENVFLTPSRHAQAATPSPNTSRQKELGEKTRRRHRDEKNQEIDSLKEQIEGFKNEVEEKDSKINELNAQIEKMERNDQTLQNKLENNDLFIKTSYKNLASDGKRQYRESVIVSEPELPKGTLGRLRKETGINFSIPPANKDGEKSEIKTMIEEFAFDNTIEVPDKRKVKQGIRYRTSSKLSLFESFDSQYPNVCSYVTFTRYWPKNFIKPKASDLGTCMCIICENAELKAEQLKKHIGSEHSLETVIENSRHDDFEAENTFKEALEKLVEGENKSVVGYLRWEKVKQTDTSKNTGRAKSDRVMRISKTETVNKLAASMLEEFETYKSHLERVSEMKREVKAMKVEAEENGDLAVLHIDWAEQHKLIEMREVQSAYFNGRWHYDIHTGYWYSKEDSHGIASISNCPDHKAEAVHAAIKGEITKLVEKGKTTIVIVSDGPTSQYRNSKNVFLMKRLAVELQICIRLLFTESGHGKSPCDGVGGNIKTQVEEVMLRNHGEHEVIQIKSVEDVKELIENKTRLIYDISIHTEKEIEDIRESMPKLGPLVGAMKIHEVLISSNGIIKKKNLPSDVFYQNVNIKESRRHRRVSGDLEDNEEVMDDYDE